MNMIFDDLKEDITYRVIDERSALGFTSFWSPICGSTVTLGSSSYYSHLKNPSRRERKIDDIIKRFNYLEKSYKVLTDLNSNYVGSSEGYDGSRFDTITDTTNRVHIILKDYDLYSVRRNRDSDRMTL